MSRRAVRAPRRGPVAAALALACAAHGAAWADEVPVSSERPPAGFEAQIKIERRRIVLGERIYFEHGRGRILPVSFPILDALAARLRPRPQIELVQVEGHTDSVGPRNVNHRLSAFRARAVRDYLIQRGVPARRLVAKGFGAEWPIASNLTAEGRERNRRVEFVIIQVMKRHVWRRRPATNDYAVAIRAGAATEKRGPEGAARPLAQGQPVYPGDMVQTPAGQGAILRLPGIVLVRVGPESALLLESVRGDPTDEGGRTAALRLSRGRVSLRAYLPPHKKGTTVSIEAGGASLRLADAEVRVVREAGGARVEVLDGEVTVRLGAVERTVRAGGGLRIDAVAATLAPVLLPAAPTGHAPRSGEVPEVVLRWQPVPGAASYLVELARDVDFLDVVSRHEVDATTLRPDLRPGTYYWRVRTRAASGLESPAWPIFKVTRR